jgi:hypothetical protein
LYAAANHYFKPSTAGVSHVGGDYTARYVALMRVTPRDTPRTDVDAEFDETLSGELVQVEL